MKRKFSIAIVLAMILTLTFTSLAFAANPAAHVEFKADAPCPVTVQVLSYTNPANQSGKMASGSTPWILDTYPVTSVTFFYPTLVVCNGTTYSWVSTSPSNPVTSGATDSTTTITASYALPGSDATAPVWSVPADFSMEATGPTGAVVTYTASASDPDDAVSTQSCLPASGDTFPLGTTTVNCTATDTHSNTGTASFKVTVVDTTPPALTLPDDMTVLASNASGAAVSFTASANDLVDGPVPVDCSPASGSQFPIGVTTVNCSATDSHSNKASGSFTITVESAITGGQCKDVPSRQILPPIKSDGSSVFKQGRTVPAKFRICDKDGKPITTAGLVTDFKLIQIISQGNVSEVTQAVLSANSHDEFRAGARQWIFNISTKNLAAGNTYVYLITLNDGSTIQFQFTLK